MSNTGMQYVPALMILAKEGRVIGFDGARTLANEITRLQLALIEAEERGRVRGIEEVANVLIDLADHPEKMICLSRPNSKSYREMYLATAANIILELSTAAPVDPVEVK